jgi:transcription factor MBP1
MRRRGDDWINATHILKAAKYEKSIRTRILEREVQKGVHEKVQGGYGKYQGELPRHARRLILLGRRRLLCSLLTLEGTWIPLHDGRNLAQKNGVLEKLQPIFDFVAGDRSPPPAPKHSTAASRPRVARASNAKRAVG